MGDGRWEDGESVAEKETNNLDRKSFSNLNYVFKCCLVDRMCASLVIFGSEIRW